MNSKNPHRRNLICKQFVGKELSSLEDGPERTSWMYRVSTVVIVFQLRLKLVVGTKKEGGK